MLIVEDEYLIARDLSRYFRSMGAYILGPTSDVDAAAQQVDAADAAVLDIDLDGRKVFPVADALMDRNVPFVFFTGRGDIAIPMRFRHVGHLSKPMNTRAVFDAIFPPASRGDDSDAASDVFATLPKLRLAALLLMEDAASADRLVELTLEHALDNLDRRSEHRTLEAWLTTLLEDIHARHGRDLLQ